MSETNELGSRIPPGDPPRRAVAEPPPLPPPKSALYGIFMGPNGMRAGLRLLIFFAIVVAFIACVRAVVHAVEHATGHSGPAAGFTMWGVLLSEIIQFTIVLVASWIMTRIEARKIADYGLPARRAFCRQFWQGAVIGFGGISALLMVLWLAGAFSFGDLALHGGEIWKYGVIWGVAFLFVGFFEEYGVRGYPLFTLTTGIGFWPAAIFWSFIFGLGHYFNPGETALGAFSAGAFGFLFCLILRRTGDLWMPIGFHLGWDWGETYFYGVADSGQVAKGHLLNSSFHGANWLTGGTVGPEASWLCIALLVIFWIIFSAWFRQVKYPNPAAIPDFRARA
jgi:membrane protease YdiL (CAAX protease family)